MKKILIVALFSMTIMTQPLFALTNEQREVFNAGIQWFDVEASSVCGDTTISAEPTAGFTSTVDATKNTKSAFDYFRAPGKLTQEKSAGILGNLLIETGHTMDPTVEQGFVSLGFNENKETGYGLAQWTSLDRKQKLKIFGEETLRPIGIKPIDLEFDMQLDFIWFEMTGEPKLEKVSGANESGAFSKLEATTNVKDATEIFARFYERNRDSLDYKEGKLTWKQAFQKRYDAALGVLNSHGDSTNTYTPTGQVCGFDSVVIAGDTTHIPCVSTALSEYVAVGYKEGLPYNIRVCVIADSSGGSGPHVNSQISAAVDALFRATASSGVIISGGGFRTMQGQRDARDKNGCPDYTSSSSTCRVPTAPAGYSNHQMGLAIDFSYKGQAICFPNSAEWCRINGNNPGFVWLDANANDYGLLSLKSEAWHWSVDGK